MSFVDYTEMPDVGGKLGNLYTVIYKDPNRAITVGPGITYVSIGTHDSFDTEQREAVELLVWRYHRPHPQFSEPDHKAGWACDPESGVAMPSLAFGELVRWAARTWTPPP